jgi:hypothetical protein
MAHRAQRWGWVSQKRLCSSEEPELISLMGGHQGDLGVDYLDVPSQQQQPQDIHSFSDTPQDMTEIVEDPNHKNRKVGCNKNSL